MSDVFVLNHLPDNTWAVSWPNLEELFTKRMKMDLFDLIFSVVESVEVGLGVARSHYDETSIVWLQAHSWLHDKGYIDLMANYNYIRGIVFLKKAEAEQFKEILEKRYMWQLLQD